MKRHELLDHLSQRWAQFDLLESGDGAEAPVPRQAEIDNRLARKIRDQLGITSIR